MPNHAAPSPQGFKTHIYRVATLVPTEVRSRPSALAKARRAATNRFYLPDLIVLGTALAILYLLVGGYI